MNLIDASGHRNGYGSPEYLRDIEMIDGYVGDVYAAYERAGVLDDTLFMVTADHGGIANTHGGGSPEEMNVYFGARGHNVNNVVIKEMCIQDIPAIITYALGVTAPSHWVSSVPPEMFEN
jgi:membrane-anchored protein YejM (alkaline phosphatase superfamily)